MSKIQIFVVALFLTIKKLTDLPAPTIDALMQGKLAGVAYLTVITLHAT